MYGPGFARDPRIVQMPGMVERLAESEDMEILVALAENPALPDFPPGVLAQLLSSPAMETILQRDDLPWDQLPFAPYAILRGGYFAHLQAAQRPDLHAYPQAAWRLARHPIRDVREALAANPAIGQIKGLVEEIARRESDAGMQRSLASNPALARYPDVAGRLAASGGKRRQLAENPALPALPEDVIHVLLQDADIFLYVIAKRDDLPWDQPPFAPYAILRGGLADHMRAARRPDLHAYPQAAWLLARHPDSSVREALAANPAIGQIEGFVEEIARRESDASMQRGLASNPALARRPEIARKLATCDEETRRRLAKNPALLALPEDVVHALLQDTDVFLRVLAQRDDLPWDQPPLAPYAILHGDYFAHRQAALRPDLHEHPQAAWLLARHPDSSVREALAINPAIGQIEGLVREIAKRKFGVGVRRSLASNPALARYPEIARKLATYDDRETRRRLAKNPALLALPEDVVQALLQDADVFLHVLARRDDLPWDQPPFAPYAILRGNFISHMGAAVRSDLHKYPQAAWHLAKHPDSSVREALAANPAIGQIEWLVEEVAQQESDASVQRGLARNPLLAQRPEIARKLAAYDKKTLEWLAENPALPALPEDVVRVILQDANAFLYVLAWRDDLPWDQPPFAPYAILRGDFVSHKRVAQRPNLHEYPQAAWHLARHPDDSVREALAANPAIGQIEGLVEEIAQQESHYIQRSLASNPVLARRPEIARKLAAYDDIETRRRLAGNPALSALPEDVAQALLQDADIFLHVLARRDDLPWDRPPFAPYAAMRPRPAQPTQPAAQQQRNDGWIEIKAIHGRRYRYLRWREGGKKRSRYLGKEKE